jgi:diacylglycerol O-acyltransferase / wax synthase
MLPERLSPLDASFLAVETPTAHMHVGWAAVFEPPPDRPAPRFADLRRHVALRLPRAPRYRQMLRTLPLGLGAPAWVDDPNFDLERHVVRAGSARLADVVADAMSEPLPRDRPLWQLRIADRLDDGRLGVVGKVHHCMVDGLAAVELASLLLDPEPDASDPARERWRPAPSPSSAELVASALAATVRTQLDLAAIGARIATSPARIAAGTARMRRVAAALADAARPASLQPRLNPPISPRRHLGLLRRPIGELLLLKQAFEVTLNDVVLAVSAGGVRRFLRAHGEDPTRLKTMVPVSVRERGDAEHLGNAISFMFVDLPCDEPDPVRRVREVRAATARRKYGGFPAAGADVIRSIGLIPPAARSLVSRLIASPRTFNLVVSNIPGPSEPLYMRGCRLVEAFPVVPVADRHALSIGVTTIGDLACFGLYADRQSLPEIESLAGSIEAALDELLERAHAKTSEPLALAMPGTEAG